MDRSAFRQTIQVNEMLEDLMETESSDVLMIDYLSVISPSEQASFLWKQILESRRRHYDWLRSVYYQLNGRWPEVDQEIFRRPSSYEEGLTTQMTRTERRKLYMQSLMNQMLYASVYFSQSLQIIYNQLLYEELLLRHLRRF
ncbi:hypothetical protein [Alkalihalophilus marmarensis]|uniref:hypothetical protein n=1 Tax=Alkalihalophilus marmarensis TaxID=521377 RepID=UPI002DC031A0|nr:hypothetical protein [Alkalihalophilus marmarensis]MEC2072376.1 hypothetical protein [Alkalihalophilus marmarensis]